MKANASDLPNVRSDPGINATVAITYMRMKRNAPQMPSSLMNFWHVRIYLLIDYEDCGNVVLNAKDGDTDDKSDDD
jgi:hypothetical protein